jgi:Ser/Thr protein kinase RdoA (MazF antagonist)
MMLDQEEPLAPDVLRHWDLVPNRIALLKAGGNTHWRVWRGGDTFVLRQYRATAPPAIAYEFQVLQHLRDRGWPVAVPLGDVAWRENVGFALFSNLPGQARAQEDQRNRRQRGRILAQLHQDLPSCRHLGQRTGWLRADEVVLRGAGTLEALTDADPHMIKDLSSAVERIGQRLGECEVAGCATGVIHGDLVSQNLLFEGPSLTGIIDLDSTHFDFCAVDVACARRSRHDDVVQGYLEVGSLTELELEHLDDFWKASVLRYAFHVARAGVRSRESDREMEWCRQQLEKTRPFGRPSSST